MALSAGVIAWVLYSGRADSVAEAALTMSFINLMATIGSYAFGASWENKK
ncbi:hypothetical protein [Roseovarius sp. A-2]|nr:hypothetical protein [Roseovarius sp. A-2]